MQETLLAEWFGAPLPPAIPGLRYLSDYIDAAEEAALLAAVDAQPWERFFQRRIQQYGIGYGGGGRGAMPVALGPLPDWLQPLARRVHADGLIARLPENAVVNEYLPGQGIAPHRDYADFGDTVLSLSLGSPCVMELIDSEGSGRHDLTLMPRSLLVLAEEARSRWKHGIAARRSDRIAGERVARGRRVSITFRIVA